MDAVDIEIDGQILLRGDSQSADRLVKNWSVSQRTKHMEVRTHFTRHAVLDAKRHGLLRVPSVDNPADMHTKPLSNQPFALNRERTMVLLQD